MDKRATRKTGLIAGSFDLIHPGYVRMFKESRKFCNHLIVALQDDPTTDRPNKCKPVHSIDERREILMSLKDVDEVIVYTDEKSLYELLQVTNYDVRILGSEYKDVEFNGKDLDKQVAWIDRNHEYSTTRLKEKIYAERKKYKERVHDSVN